jgi:chorismate mutase / prephenate dehydratase
MAEGADSLAELRARIDAIDDEILGLLDERAAIAARAKAAKQAGGREVYDPNRERAIIDRLQTRAGGRFPVRAIRPVFQEIISACLSVEKGVQVAYLGPEGTFTHQAVKRHFGSSATALPAGTIAAVFAEIERGGAEWGVVPVENSSEGIVNHTLDSFLDSSLCIAAEIVVPIEQCLLARADVALSAIERVYSHPQALAQCRDWLSQNLPSAAQVEAASTADAARSAASDGHGAAIGAEPAGRLYGLVVARSPIQDLTHNVTRFLVIGRPGSGPAATGQGNEKTTVLLALADRAGALLDVLAPLSAAGINLSKIESRPSRRRAWDYVFFLDLDGHASDPAVADVLARIAADCQLFKVLGSYRKADPR